jgi:hypothetical protein
MSGDTVQRHASCNEEFQETQQAWVALYVPAVDAVDERIVAPTSPIIYVSSSFEQYGGLRGVAASQAKGHYTITGSHLRAGLLMNVGAVV